MLTKRTGRRIARRETVIDMKKEAKRQHKINLKWVLLAGMAVLLFVAQNFYGGFGRYFFRQFLIMAFLTIGVSIQMIAGNFDLSFAAQVSASTVLGAFCIRRGMPVMAALSAMLLFHMLLGALKGVLMVKLRIPPILMTLALQMILSGLLAGITGENSILFQSGQFYRNYLFEGGAVGVFLVLVITAYLLLNHSYYGRYCRMIGENLELAEESGLNCTLIAVLVHCFGSLFFLAAAVIMMLETSSGSSYLGSNYLYKALAAACIGGIGLRTGKGTISGMLVGNAVVVLAVFALTGTGELNKLETIMEGIIIVVFLALQEREKKN